MNFTGNSFVSPEAAKNLKRKRGRTPISMPEKEIKKLQKQSAKIKPKAKKESELRPIEETHPDAMASQTAKEILNTKVCTRCGEIKPLDSFMPNIRWTEERGVDRWCKSCLGSCRNKKEMLEYAWENRRAWKDDDWELCEDSALNAISKTSVFKNATDRKRQALVERAACEQYAKDINAHYVYELHQEDGEDIPFTEAFAGGLIKDKSSENATQWSQEFYGYYKKKEIALMKTRIAGIPHNENDAHEVDYVRKLAKLSLLIDNKMNEVYGNSEKISELMPLMTQFDNYSKSMNLTASKKPVEDKKAESSFGDIILQLEESGYPCTRKVQWEPDDVDRTINEFKKFVSFVDLG